MTRLRAAEEILKNAIGFFAVEPACGACVRKARRL